jgi:hypothetical protein
MKATKIFMMAALALTFAACSNNDDNDFAQQPAEQPANGEITITATLDANDGVSTRALSIDGSNIASTWETTDQFAILYNNGTENTKSIATVDKIDGTTVTITFTIPASLANNTPCTIVYPASAANAANTGADVATALATQDGTIENCPEVRVGTATIDKDNHSLSSVTKLAAQNAIFQFDTQDLTPSGIPVSEFKVSDGSGNVITTVTPSGTPFYVALPAMAAGTYWFNATYSGKPYIAKATVTTATTAGKFYTTTVKMATLGDVIKADGKFYAAGTADAVAKIAYVGSDAETSTTYNHGLALALSDVSGAQTWCTQETCTCLSTHYASESDAMTDMAGIANTDALVAYTSHTHAAANTARNYNSGTHPAGTSAWFLPSAGQWYKMRNAAGSYGTLRTNAGLESSDYWSSSVVGDKVAWYFDFKNIAWLNSYKDGNKRVRSCLAF